MTSAIRSHAAVREVATCSYSDVLAAVTSAAVGDTITVPAGSCTWTNTLNINKGISLVGAGVGKTILIKGANALISYTPLDPTANALIRISGFTFDLNGGGH